MTSAKYEVVIDEIVPKFWGNIVKHDEESGRPNIKSTPIIKHLLTTFEINESKPSSKMLPSGV